MEQTTTIRSPASIALGGLFAAGTIAVLLNDVTSAWDLTTDHMMTVLVLIGTIASGHMLWAEARARRWLAVAGLAVLFGAGTVYCVTTSAARNADVTAAKAAHTRHANVAYTLAKDAFDAATKRHAEAVEAETKECSTGIGPLCKAARAQTPLRKAEKDEAERRLQSAPAPQPEQAGLAHAATVFATLPGVTAKAEGIERGLILLLPFIKALFLEVACIVFLSIGLGHRRPPAPAPAVVAETPAELVAIRERFFDPEPVAPPPPSPPPRPRRKRRTALGSNVVAFGSHPVVKALAKVDRPVSNRELAKLMSVSDGEASKRWQEVVHALDVCRQGKQLQLSLRRQRAVS